MVNRDKSAGKPVVDQFDLRELVHHRELVSSDASLASVYEFFARSPHDFVGVVEGVRFAGLCSRAQLGFLMASRFGFAIYSKDSVRQHLMPSPLAVRLGTPLMTVLSDALSRTGKSFEEDVVLLGSGEEYLGLISTETLVHWQTWLLRENMQTLEGQRESLHRKNGELTLLTGRLNSTNEELAKARDAALESARLKSMFLANMSHEIRTPMNGIMGMIGLLQEMPLPAEQREMVTTVHHCAEDLLVILNDILDFSKMEASQLRLEAVPFHPNAVLREVFELHATRGRQKGLRMSWHIYDLLPPRLIGDPTRIRQILNNLLGNAVKFTEHGFVDLQVRVEGAGTQGVRLRVEVHDSGIGIAPDVQGKLFQPFTQADGSDTRRFGGTGLGLAISRHLAELMGGTVGLSSTLGEGSCFWLELELAKPVTEGFRSLPARVSDQPDDLVEAPRLRVLLVEDNAVNRAVALKMLRKLGHETECARNGVEGLAAYAARHHDLILMDCQMPELDGYAATRKLREEEAAGRSPHVPIIALTANAMPEDRQRCLEAGMDDYLPKPFKIEALEAAILRVPKAGWPSREPLEETPARQHPSLASTWTGTECHSSQPAAELTLRAG